MTIQPTRCCSKRYPLPCHVIALVLMLTAAKISAGAGPANTPARSLDPSSFNLQRVGVYPPGTGQFGGISASDVKVMGDLAYLAGDSLGVQVVDLTDLTRPTLVRQRGGPVVKASRIFLADGQAYLGSPFLGVSIFSLANPCLPARRSVGGGLSPANDLSVAGGHAFVAGNRGFQVIDVRNPRNPALVAEVNTLGQVFGVDVAGGFAYLANAAAGLQVFDVRDPSRPVRIGSCDTPGEATGVQVVGDHAYVADGFAGLQVVDIRAPDRPVVVASLNPGGAGGAKQVRVVGDLAVVAAGRRGLQVIDVSDPLAPVLAGVYVTSESVGSADLVGNHAFITTPNSLEVIRLRDGLAQTIDFNPPTTVRLTEGPLRLEAAASSGLPVSFRVLSGPASVSGDQLHLTGTGPVIVRAEQPGGIETVAATVTRTITVEHPNLTVRGARSRTLASLEASVPARIAAVATGTHHGLFLDESGGLAGWGRNLRGEAKPPVGATNLVDVAAGGGHTLALRRDGTLLGWGQNWAGQTNVPSAATNVVALGAGWAHSAALRADGGVLVWGDNEYQQLELPPSATNVIALDCGFYHTLALRADGRVVSWGLGGYASNVDEQGEPFPPTSDEVPASATNIVAISAGWGHSLAVREDGTVLAWGDNSYGQLAVPPSATNVVAVSAGFYHSVALRADGTTVAWGRDAFGVVTSAATGKNIAVALAGEDFSLTATAESLPVLGTLPESIRTPAGGLTVVKASVFGPPALALQWFRGEAAVPAATNSTLVIRASRVADSGSYRLQVSGPGGVQRSESVQVMVVPESLPSLSLARDGAPTDDFLWVDARVEAGILAIVESATELGSWEEYARITGQGFDSPQRLSLGPIGAIRHRYWRIRVP